MSFVETVLQVSSKLEKEELSKHLSTLSEQLSATKRLLHQDVTERYLDFHTHCARSADLSSRVGLLLNDATVLQGKIDEHVLQQLHASTSEFHQLSAQLQETKAAIQVLEQLVHVEESMNAAKEAQTRGDHLERARKVKAAEELLPPLSCGREASDVTSSPPPPPSEELSLLKALREAVVLQREILLFDLGEAWKESWLMEEREDDGGELGDDSLMCTRVALQVKQKFQGHLQALAASLQLHGELDVKLRRLGARVLSSLVRPMGRHHAKVVPVEDGIVAWIRKDESQPDFVLVVDNLKAVIDFLSDAFDSPDGDASVMRCFGAAVSKDFCEFFLRECVLPNVPNSGRDLDSYSQVLGVLEEFQRHLESKQFLDAASGRMLDHARDVDALLANHLSHRLLVQARALMLEDLQDVEELTEDKSSPASLLQNPFSFPRCHISRSTRKLLALVESALDEACSSTPVCAVRLLHTCRGVMEMYCSLVPQHHTKGLESVPEQSALLHNNCMYLAHRLLLATNSVRSSLPPPLCNDATLSDMAPVLRQTGTMSLLRQMQRQRQHFYDALKDGFPTLAAAAAAPAADRSLQRCLLQLGHLERVWRPVLPLHVYRRTMGTLLNSVLEELLVRVTTVEDIPADCAVYLVTVLGAFLDQAPGVFRDEGGKDVGLAELCKLVPKWEKFRELVHVLDASLRELEERWAEGKGPLADHFTPDELKHLIRALFQNTDRRAAVLANIK